VVNRLSALRSRDIGTSSCAVEFLDYLLHDALEHGASDLHLLPGSDGFSIRYRINGALIEPVLSMEKRPAYENLLLRLKVLAGMDGSRRLVPHDGAMRFQWCDRTIDARVACLPCVDGEAAVLRLFDRERQGFSLDELGMDRRCLSELRSGLSEPSGLFLVAGPIGSGKTTTLYSILRELSDGGRKVMTIEDPVEARIEGAVQIAVNEKAGLTFATGLRSIVRHDPDIIMIGEIRDNQTAMVAVHAAVLGHLVLASIHAESAHLAIERLVHMDVDRYQLTIAFNAIVAQRLVRKSPERGAGRLGLFEVLRPDRALRERLIRGDGLLDSNLQSLWRDGQAKVARGLTTQDELNRVLGSRRGEEKGC